MKSSLDYARYGVCANRDAVFLVANLGRKDTTALGVNAGEKFIRQANNILDTTPIEHLGAIKLEATDSKSAIAMCNPHGFTCPTCQETNRIFGICDKPTCASQLITRQKTRDDGCTDVVVFSTGKNLHMLIHADGTFEANKTRRSKRLKSTGCLVATFVLGVSDVLVLLDSEPNECEQIAEIVAQDIRRDQEMYRYAPNTLDRTCSAICAACESVQNVLLIRFTTLHASNGSRLAYDRKIWI